MLRLLEIDERIRPPLHGAGQESHLLQQCGHLAAGLLMTGGQFHVVPLLRICNAAAGQKRAPQERRPTAVLLQQPEVYVQRHDLLRIVPQRVDDPRQLLPIRDAEDELAPSVALRRLVEPQRKRLVKQLGKPRGKLRIFRDDPYLRRRECVAV